MNIVYLVVNTMEYSIYLHKIYVHSNIQSLYGFCFTLGWLAWQASLECLTEWHAPTSAFQSIRPVFTYTTQHLKMPSCCELKLQWLQFLFK